MQGVGKRCRVLGRYAGCCGEMQGVGKRCRVTWRDAGCGEEMHFVLIK
jgi:hypothetical protein